MVASAEIWVDSSWATKCVQNDTTCDMTPMNQGNMYWWLGVRYIANKAWIYHYATRGPHVQMPRRNHVTMQNYMLNYTVFPGFIQEYMGRIKNVWLWLKNFRAWFNVFRHAMSKYSGHQNIYSGSILIFFTDIDKLRFFKSIERRKHTWLADTGRSRGRAWHCGSPDQVAWQMSGTSF